MTIYRKVLLYGIGLFKIDHAGGPVGTPIHFIVMSSCNVVNNALHNALQHQGLHSVSIFVVHARRRIGVWASSVNWILSRLSPIIYWFGCGSLHISLLLLQVTSKMRKIGLPAMPASAVLMGTTSVCNLFCLCFCLVF